MANWHCVDDHIINVQEQILGCCLSEQDHALWVLCTYFLSPMTFFKPVGRAKKKLYLTPMFPSRWDCNVAPSHSCGSSLRKPLTSSVPLEQVHSFACIMPQSYLLRLWGALGESPLTNLNAMHSPTTSISGAEGWIFLACRGSHRTAKEKAKAVTHRHHLLLTGAAVCDQQQWVDAQQHTSGQGWTLPYPVYVI